MPVKLTQKAFVEKCLAKHGSKYSYANTIYQGPLSEITITCPTHGDFSKRARQHLLGSGCLRCSREVVAQSINLGLPQFKQRADQVHSLKYSYEKSIYVNNHTKITITCPTHGDFSQSPSSHLNGSGCPKCSLEKKAITFSSFRDRSNLMHKFFYSYKEETYTTINNRTSIICPLHGEFRQRAIRHANLGQGCPNCANSSKRLKEEDILALFTTSHGAQYDYSKTTYTTYKDPIEIICPKHGSFFSTPSNHILGTGCPNCATFVSKPHQRVIDYITSLGVGHVINTRSVIAPFELDIYLPTPSLAIEINGIYRHSTSYCNQRVKNKHLNKLALCNSINVHLLQFTDLEISNQLPIVKSIISSNLKSYGRVLHARKCALRAPTKEEVKTFLTENHIQGFVGSRIELGMYCSGELVQVMTFGKPRMNKGYEWELIRLCSRLNTKVVGGASRLFKHFTKAHLKEGERVISYCDLRLFKGDIYKRLGFKWLRNSSPNYFYTKGQDLESRQKFQKHKLPKILDSFDPDLTEMQNMFNNGYRVIFDCGNGVWEFQRN